MQDFTIIPNDLYIAYANGDLTPTMFLAMTLLHRWADWGTGVVRKMRAGRMEQATSGKVAASTFEDALRNLKKAGYISTDHIQGSRSWYSVEIHNFTALSGQVKDQVINPCQIRDWRVSKKSRRGEDSCEAGVRPGRVRGEAATVLKYSQESSLESQSKSLLDKQVVVVAASARETAEQERTETENDILELWYHHKLQKELSSVPEDKIQRDTPLVQEIIREVGTDEASRFIHWVLTHTETEDFKGWNAVTPSLHKLLGYVKQGTILVQFRDYLKELAAFEEQLRREEEAKAAAAEAAKAAAKEAKRLKKLEDIANTCKRCGRTREGTYHGYCRDCNQFDPDTGHHFLGCPCSHCNTPELQAMRARIGV